MFKNIFDSIKEKIMSYLWARSELGRNLNSYNENFFFSEANILNSFSEKKKYELMGKLYKEVIGITSSENSLLDLRNKLVEYVLEYAQIQVICLTLKDKEESIHSEYVSGQLYPFIQKLAGSIESLEEYILKETPTDEELMQACNVKCTLLIYYINGLNVLRIDMDDHKKEDWLRPFILSMMIVYEDNFRKSINLPSLLKQNLDNLNHSTFMNVVRSGADNPYEVWLSEDV